ncbi:MAG: hypothetical protein AABO57_03420 [Acidobacteriota bacterium]
MLSKMASFFSSTIVPSALMVRPAMSSIVLRRVKEFYFAAQFFAALCEYLYADVVRKHGLAGAEVHLHVPEYRFCVRVWFHDRRFQGEMGRVNGFPVNGSPVIAGERRDGCEQETNESKEHACTYTM